jgi:hypothetical protein
MQGFGRESDGKRPLGRLRRRWEDSIKLEHKEPEWQGGIGYSWLNVVDAAKRLLVPLYGAGEKKNKKEYRSTVSVA